ncbi:hypothetical protein [Gillisia hiemivivida]|uniref:Uncharacterized protein n=1 Tax=Gillisia hiemivivida TaxID=291190 RepID=A0A5C6ZYI4_9FLAO|nr:hypothetical protein [Gillisia hiemivivida]TXD95186.1 hypothetical protein ES724_03270 [Gillisia hiemivivida]
MSNNGSKSAHKFLGKSWGLSKAHSSNISIFYKDRIEAKRKAELSKKKKKEIKIQKRILFGTLFTFFGVSPKRDHKEILYIKNKFFKISDISKLEKIITSAKSLLKNGEKIGVLYTIHDFVEMVDISKI